MALATPPTLHTRRRCLLSTTTMAKDTNNRLLIASLNLRPPSIIRTMQLIRAVPTLLASIQIASQFHLSSQIQSMTPLTLRFYPRTSTVWKTHPRRFLDLRALPHPPPMKRLLHYPITSVKTITAGMILTQECSRLPITNFIALIIPTSSIPDTLTVFILPSGGHHVVDFRP